MIELDLNGTRIALPAGTILTKEIETNVFDRGIVPTSLTYPVTLPLTDTMKVAFGMPHVISNYNYKKKQQAHFYVDGVWICLATIQLQEVNLKAQTITISILGDFGSYANMLGDKKVNELYMDGIRTIAGGALVSSTYDWGGLGNVIINYQSKYLNASNHIRNVANGTIVTDYMFYQASDEIMNISGNGINVLNSWLVDATHTGVFDDPVRSNIFFGANDAVCSDRFWWVPFFRLHYVLKKCFSEFGYTVASDMDGDVMFDKITLHNTYAINECELTESVNGGNQYVADIIHHCDKIDPRNHVPPIRIIDFITGIAKTFNLQYFINHKDKTVRIKQWKTINYIPGDPIVDLSAGAEPMPVLNFKDESFITGYLFSFSPDGTDSVSGSDNKNEFSKYHLRGAVQAFGDLAGIPAAAKNDLAFVRSTADWFIHDGTDWQFYAGALGDLATNDQEGKQEINPEVNPVRSQNRTPIFHWFHEPWAGPGSGDWYGNTYDVIMPNTGMGMLGKNLLGVNPIDAVATGLNGAAYMGSFFLVNPELKEYQPHICNAHGLQYGSGSDNYLYPYGSITDVDAKGRDSTTTPTSALTISGYRLYWSDPDGRGLYHEFHWKEWVEALAGAIQADWTVLFDINKYLQTDLLYTYIRIDGQNYLCRKGSINMPFPNKAKLTLVRI